MASCSKPLSLASLTLLKSRLKKYNDNGITHILNQFKFLKNKNVDIFTMTFIAKSIVIRLPIKMISKNDV